jgi:CubicO group peptidase (beta-lactamase class C family)
MPLLMKTISHIISIGILSILVLLQVSCGSQQDEQVGATSKVDKINEIVGLYADYEGYNGSVLVSHDGEIIYKKGFGMANMEWDVPNQVDTKFVIASVTKPFTSMLIMQLVAENKLDLHEPITTYLPDYPKENGEQITIHHILSHTSGIPRDYDGSPEHNKYPDRHRLASLVALFWEESLEFKPGERFTYSNSGYMVLGYIIETVTGKSYETVLKENILTPLGMKNTGVDLHRPIIKNRASGYFKGFGEYFNSDYRDLSAITAVGNIYSTVEDMFLWDQALYTETLLPKKYMDQLFTKHVEDSGYGGHHGYGWELKPKPVGNTSEMIETIGHSGSMQGFCALFTRIPSSNSSIIFLNNTSRAFLNAMTTAITAILNDQPYDFPRKPTAKFMSEVIAKEGIEKGIQFYKEHKDLSDYYIDEVELIVAGYRLLHAGNAKDAAEVFKLSTEVYPDNDNPYDSYAEALMTLGKNEEAIKNYKKSLELNPRNNNAVEMLKKLEGKS